MDQLLLLMKNENPDVILLQEIKCENENFPLEKIQDMGFNACFYGQKSYNGVAILSKNPFEDILFGMPEFEEAESRYIEAVTYYGNTPIKVASVYVPNGQPNGDEAKSNVKAIESKRFKYKLEFLTSLKEHLKSHTSRKEYFIIGGDINVAPFDIDVYSVKNWEGKVCFLPEEKAIVRGIINLGFSDCVRMLAQGAQVFSWYDYRTRGFDTGKGLRIDHFFASPNITDYLKDYKILDYYRGLEKPSDHVPIQININL